MLEQSPNPNREGKFELIIQCRSFSDWNERDKYRSNPNMHYVKVESGATVQNAELLRLILEGKFN